MCGRFEFVTVHCNGGVSNLIGDAFFQKRFKLCSMVTPNRALNFSTLQKCNKKINPNKNLVEHKINNLEGQEE